MVAEVHPGAASRPGAGMAGLEARMRRLVAPRDGTVSPAERAALNHLEAGGRRLRARFGLQAGCALGLVPGTAEALAAGAELLHNASLVHDDLKDGDCTRRGRASVWAAFGSDVAICAGDLMISGSFAAVAPAVPDRAGALAARLHGAVHEAVQGQASGCTRGVSPPLDPAGYDRLAEAKSGALLALPVELALIAAGQEAHLPAAARAGRRFALGYQIADDLADLDADVCAGTTNAVIVLARAQGVAPAKAAPHAARRAVAALGEARRAAATLPDKAGEGLGDAARRLARELGEVAHAA